MKPYYASKTLWANLVGGVAMLTGAFGLDMGLSPGNQTKLVAGIIVVVNIFLRFITKQPISNPGPTGGRPPLLLTCVLIVGMYGCDAIDASTGTTFEERCKKYHSAAAVAKALPRSPERDKRIEYYEALLITCSPT